MIVYDFMTCDFMTTRFLIYKAKLLTELKKIIIIVQELCKSRGGRPGLSVLTSLLVSVDVKIY